MSKHRHFHPPSVYAKSCIKDYARSITRGLGGDQQKRGFVLENLQAQWMAFSGADLPDTTGKDTIPKVRVEAWR